MDITTNTSLTKPLGRKAYGSIPHLPGSRLGPGDHHINKGQTAILLSKARNVNDIVIVQQKLDGACTAVAKIDGALVPLSRAGVPAIAHQFEHLKLFAQWAYANTSLFDFLEDGERVVGEWLALAHGTRYNLPHLPFVPFDIMRGDTRLTYSEFATRIGDRFVLPQLISVGPPMSIEVAVSKLSAEAHGAIDPVEGCVWRVESQGKVEFLAKYVRHDKVDGTYLKQAAAGNPVWNWRPPT